MSNAKDEMIKTADAITVSIVEDDAAVRSSLSDILARASDIVCVSQYARAETALREVPVLNPRVVLMDINLPGMDGVECVRRLSVLVPKTQIVMLTVFNDTDAIFRSLAAGACGYLLKPVRAEQLCDAVRDVYAGGAPMSGKIARKVVQAFKQIPQKPHPSEDLSPRELEILDLLSKGYAYKEIAAQLFISYHTVHTHIEHIYTKLHVCSRGEAVAKYLGV